MPFVARPLLASALALLLATGAQACDITDMTGRVATMPDHIASVITLGSVPVLNSFVEASGHGELIVSGLPERFARAGRWDLQYALAPHIKDAPDLQNNGIRP